MSAHRKFAKDACERCGARETGTTYLGPGGGLVSYTLHVHHRDRDVSNNDPMNLETLCHWCHSKEHAADIRETKRNMVYLRLSSSQRARWDDAAALRGVTLSQLVRGAVELHLGAEPAPDVGRDRVREERGYVGVPAHVPVQERSFTPDFGKRLKP